MSVVLNRSGPDLLARWQEQIGRHRSTRLCRGSRPFAAMFFHCRGYAEDSLVELGRLRVDVLHDIHRAGGFVVNRFARYRAGLVADGIFVGGASRVQFEKNLNMTPGRKSYGRRIGATDTQLLGAALELDKFLERVSRFPHYPRRKVPRLPRVWVGLSLDHPTGSGPAFDLYCKDTGWPTELALTSIRRLHHGRWIFPIEFVLHHALHFRGVYCDMTTVSRRQVIRIERPDELVGNDGPCRFDFWNSCFRSGPF